MPTRDELVEIPQQFHRDHSAMVQHVALKLTATETYLGHTSQERTVDAN